MVRDINHLGSRPPTAPQSKSSDLNNAANKEKTTTDPGVKPQEGSQVELSSQASSLKAVEASTQSLPEVDLDRVAKIKAALNGNEFKVNDQQIADKMLAIDSLLGS